MAKTTNELSKKNFEAVEKKLLSLLSTTNKGLFTLAEIFDLDKNEIYSWWLLLSEEYASRDLSKKKGFTVEEGMQMLRHLMKIGGFQCREK